MKRFQTLFLSTSFLLAASCSHQGQGPNSLFELNKIKEGPAIVKVNGLEVHQGLLDSLAEMNPRIKSQLENPMTKKRILESLVDQQLLYQEAIKQGLQNKEDVILKTLLNSHVIISNALIENELEEQVKKAYEERKAEQFTKLKVAIIGKDFEKNNDQSEKQALEKITALRDQIKKGASFADLAEKESDHKITRKKAGVAGEISLNDKRFARMGLSNLVEPAFKLKVGEISDPIKTDNGYYIITPLEEPTLVPMEEAARVLRFEFQRKVKEDLLSRLKKDASVEFLVKVETPEETGDMQQDHHGHGHQGMPKNMPSNRQKLIDAFKKATQKKEPKKD
ncbi:MAG: peptidylprolyl isomerase [Deltaproteobacteria bacterium]|nr:peptidylprolyl isomerase [Deltaproteobacteria bacterium]